MTTTTVDPAASRPGGTVDRARQSLLGLPGHERNAISMVLYQGMSCRGVASALGVPEGAVRQWIRSGLRRIGTEVALDPALGPA